MPSSPPQDEFHTALTQIIVPDSPTPPRLTRSTSRTAKAPKNNNTTRGELDFLDDEDTLQPIPPALLHPVDNIQAQQPAHQPTPTGAYLQQLARHIAISNNAIVALDSEFQNYRELADYRERLQGLHRAIEIATQSYDKTIQRYSEWCELFLKHCPW